MAETLISFDALRAPVESLLTQAHARRVEISQATLLTEAERRNQVWRCALGNVSADAPQNVIVKRVDPQAYQPDDLTSWHTQRFLRDWLGAAFLTRACGEQRHGPHYYGGDRELGFVILEDMGQHRSLVEPLLEGNASEATAALVAFAERLGRMHADTLGRQDDYRQLVHEVNPAAMPWLDSSLDEARQWWRDALDYTARQCAELGVPPSAEAIAEVERAIEAVVSPGPFTAFIHADPCPDNVFYADGQLRLIDFEFSRFGHALLDGLYGRIPFPTCWCANAVPAHVVERMEARYRAELSRSCAAAGDDDLFGAARFAVCVCYTLQTLRWHLDGALKEPNHEWGIATIRARILTRLGIVEYASQQGRHSAFADCMQRLREQLQARWPESEPLPLYPAFR